MNDLRLSRDQALVLAGLNIGAFAQKQVEQGDLNDTDDKTLRVEDNGEKVSVFVSFGPKRLGIKVPFFANLESNEPATITKSQLEAL